jgi:hypothetical protein
VAKRPKPAGVADPATQAQFVLVATMSVRDGFQPLLNEPGLAAAERVDRTMVLASLLEEVTTVAPRIPADLTVLKAVQDFVAYALDPGPHWNDPVDRGVPAPWLGLQEHTVVQSFITPMTELIDDRWQAPNPNWSGLPYDRSATLRLLVHLREHDKATRQELEEVLRAFGGGDVEDALREPVEEGWVDRVEGEGGPVWSGTGLLCPYRAAIARIEDSRPPRRDIAAERRRDRQLRLARLSDKPDARALLLEVRRQKQLKSHELQPLVPHLDRNAMVRLLKQLRNAGWLEVVGTTKNAQWRATEKLLTADFRKPAPLPDL